MEKTEIVGKQAEKPKERLNGKIDRERMRNNEIDLNREKNKGDKWSNRDRDREREKKKER